ncbi:phosphatidylcholine and lysophosphatidylcholine phospholipase, partial [Coemansia spiralis]
NFYVVIDGQVQIYLADAASRIPAAGPEPATASDGEPSVSGGWSDAGDELGGAPPAESDIESDADSNGPGDSGSEAGGSSGGQPAPEEALLLNVVGPGDVLSSLLSILSLFAEGVPLRPRPQHQRGPTSSVASALGLVARGGAHTGTAPAMRGHMSQQPADQLAYDQASTSDSSVRDRHGEPRPRRPSVVARATTDTTLAMIPASAFQRVTRLYPKAAAHILQVILARLQRVTFATLYDYLDLPDELVVIERAISDLARLPLRPEIAQSDVLLRVKELYAQADRRTPSAPPPIQSPVLGSSQQRPSFSTRTTLSAGVASTHSVNLSSARQLPAAWKLTRENLEALPACLAMEPPPPAVDLGPAQLPRSRFRRHRRRGSDSAPPATLPSAAEIESLRRDALHQLCDSL